MASEREQPFTLGKVGSQQVLVAFDGGRSVSDAGLLAVHAVQKPLRVLADWAARLRAPRFIEHAAEALLTQAVYQILAGYPDCKDAQELRVDPLFQVLAAVCPAAHNLLASASTLARFPYAFTRRPAQQPREDRPVWRAIRAAQTGRRKIRNGSVVDLFLRTRRAPPAAIIRAVAARADPVHGRQTLSGYHGYYQQQQSLPLCVSDAATGFPLAAWLRPGTVPARLGARAILDTIGTRLRAVWPAVRSTVRSANGRAVPGLDDYGAAHGWLYAFGYATNPVLQRATAQALADLEWYHHCYRHREPVVQRFESWSDYQAESGPHPRRIVATVAVTLPGRPRRCGVTNLEEPAAVVYRDFDVQRGKVPEQPIGAMKNGGPADRLSAGGFGANALRLLVPTLAYAMVVLFREAVAAVPAVATATVSRWRPRRWKSGAVVVTGVRRIWFHLSETWPPRDLWGRVLAAVPAFVPQMPAGSSGATAEPRGDGSKEKRPGAARVRRRRPGPSKGYRAAAQAATTTPGRGCVAKDRYNSVLRGSPLHLLRHGARCGLVIHRSSYDRWAGHSCPAWLRDKSVPRGCGTRVSRPPIHSPAHLSILLRRTTWLWVVGEKRVPSL